MVLQTKFTSGPLFVRIETALEFAAAQVLHGDQQFLAACMILGRRVGRHPEHDGHHHQAQREQTDHGCHFFVFVGAERMMN